jgi:hypothetical protein
MVYNMAWQYNQSSNNYLINAVKITANSGGVTLSSVSNPSSGAGFWNNYNPSVVSMNDNTARLVWTGYSPWYGHRTVYRYNNTSGTWSSTVYNMGSNVTQSYINNTDDGYFVIGWVQNNGSLANYYVRSDNINSIKNFVTTGNNLQINNSASLNNMYAMTFQNQTAPYSFIQSASVGSLGKTTNSSISNGRGVAITYDSTDYCFGLGDINVDGQNIGFVPLTNLNNILSEDTLNNFLCTNDFSITNNSKITFSLFHGMISPKDTEQTINSLTSNEFIKIKAILVDAKSNETLSQIDSIDLKKGETFSTDIISNNFIPNGIGSREVRIELKVDNNIPCQYTINDFFSNENSISLTKSNSKEISYKDINLVKTYTLEQNYPNPFNPSTLIHYEMPKDGFVTLKVYDILGNIVKTLVNQYQSKGRYDINFNANNLASGIYFYRLQSGSFISTKKMLLLK